MPKESIPSKKADTLAFLESVSGKITANPADYGTDAGGATALADLVTAATEASATADADRLTSQSATAALTEALSLLVASFRNLANQARFNPDVSDESLADLGIHRKASPSRVSAPADGPVLAILRMIPGFANVALQVEGQTGHAKPAGVVGAQISVVDGTVDPSEDNPEAGVITFVSRSRSQVATDIGKARVRMYARWMNQRAEVSPWSLPQEFAPQTA